MAIDIPPPPRGGGSSAGGGAQRRFARRPRMSTPRLRGSKASVGPRGEGGGRYASVGWQGRGPTGPALSERIVFQPRNWPAAARRDMQRKLAAAGLLDEYAEGVWDPASIDAYAEALELSRGAGVSVGSMLDELGNATFFDPDTGRRRRGARGAGAADDTLQVWRRGFSAPAFQAPDPETLAMLTRQTIAQLLQRQPDSDEIAAVRGSLDQWYRESYDVEVARARTEHEVAEDQRIAEIMATSGGAPVNVTGGPVASGVDPSAPGPAAVDPEARLEDLLRQRYSSEIGRRSQSEATRRTGQIAQNMAGTLSSAIFGSARRGEI